ncbi:MAG: glycosyltransferase family A protein, partial [Thermoplasmatales archaeon]
MTVISVLICTYDRKQYIQCSIRSLLSQDLDKKYYEIIVVKGFIDKAIDEFLDSNNVKNIYLNEKSLGKKIARGISESRGDFICFLDDDDEFEPYKLSKIFEIINSDTEIDFIHNSLSKIDENGNVVSQNNIETPPGNLYFYPNSEDNSTIS